MRKYDKIYFSGIDHKVVNVYKYGSITLAKLMCEETDVPSYILQLDNGTGMFIDGCDLLCLSDLFKQEYNSIFNNTDY